MDERQPSRYLPIQIVLHWTVAVLVVMQVLLHEGMEEAWDAYEHGEAIEYGPLVILHIATGVAILLLAIWRITVRIRHGAPGLPDNHLAALKFIAHANHYLLYAFLLIMPIAIAPKAKCWRWRYTRSTDSTSSGRGT